jgi:signal transduction histidine kinase
MLFVTYLDPSEPRYYVALTYVVLSLYCAYAFLLYLFFLRKPDLFPVRQAHWIDLVWCLTLIALSSGTSSVFFFLFFFIIQIAAFRFGFHEGIKVTSASVLLFSVLGYLTAPHGEEFELNRTLLRPIYLGVLGYMISYWGGIELKLKQRLELIKDINNLYNPRFGTDLTISAILQKILVSFDVDSCLLIDPQSAPDGFFLRQCDRENPERAIYPQTLRSDHPLLRLPGDSAVIYSKDAAAFRNPFKKKQNYLAFDPENGARVEEPARNGEVLADLLNARSFISVPFNARGNFAGRLFLTSETKTFDYSDIDFLRQIMSQAAPVVENVNLLDRLASEATEQQRQKISRDIHDGTVQPYIGIKLGLEALQIKHAQGEDIAPDITRLVEIANSNITSIRGYINKLKGDAADTEKGVVLVSAIRQQAKKISEFYGVDIEVHAPVEINVSDRLSAEIFQIVSEGLSNIKRHTKATAAAIKIACDEKTFYLEIQNNLADGAAVNDFVPKSMQGRATSLGGRLSVENHHGQTKILINIPL